MNLSDASRGEDQPKVLPSNRVVINAVEIINQRQSLVWNYKRVLRIEDKNFSKRTILFSIPPGVRSGNFSTRKSRDEKYTKSVKSIYTQTRDRDG